MRRPRYRNTATTVGAVTEREVPPAALPRDPRWPRAGDWLAAGPGRRNPDLAVLGVPTFGTSLSKTGAHATPAAVRRALARFSTWCASRMVDVGDLAPWDLGDVDDPDVPVEGEWRGGGGAPAPGGGGGRPVARRGGQPAAGPPLAGGGGGGGGGAGGG